MSEHRQPRFSPLCAVHSSRSRISRFVILTTEIFSLLLVVLALAVEVVAALVVPLSVLALILAGQIVLVVILKVVVHFHNIIVFCGLTFE